MLSIQPMKLRNHPLMSYRGVSNWPPVWTQARRDSVKTVRSWNSHLCAFQSSDVEQMFFVMEHGGETYVGTLIFENDAFCRQINILLQCHLKRSIRDIGDLDLSATL